MFVYVFTLVILAYIIRKRLSKKRKSIRKKHIVITGGCSGIGKSLAVLAAKQGAHVTITARRPENLNTTLADIKQACINVNQKIQGVVLDVTNYSAVKEKLNKLDEAKPIYMLVNCAELDMCRLGNMSTEQVKTLVDISFMGVVYTTKVVSPKLKLRKKGIIVISQTAFITLFGLSMYTASKFALRSFAEALDMEVRPYNVSVTLALLPDLSIFGFNTAGILRTNNVAKRLLDDALSKKCLSSLDGEGFIRKMLRMGMIRFSSICEILLRVTNSCRRLIHIGFNRKLQ